MALSEMEKRILQLRFNTESISNAKKIDYQEYRLSKKQIISKLAEEGHKVSMVEITNFLKSKLGDRKSLDYGDISPLRLYVDLPRYPGCCNRLHTGCG